MQIALTRRFTILALSALTLAAIGCGSSSTGTTTGSGAVSIALSPSTATVQQGSSTQVTGTVTRSDGFTGDVAISVLNAPAGVTGALAGPIAAGSTTGVVTLSVATSTAVGTYTLTVQASGTGVTTATAPFTLTVSAATPPGGFTIAATPGTLSVAQGSSASTGVKATRTNGLSSAIALTSSNVPSGLTVTFATTSVADSSAVTVAAATSIAPGSYPITVTGTSGLLTQQATITVTVVGTARVDFSACAAAARPVWVAYQDGSGAWTHITGTADAYTLPFFSTGKGAVAFVTQGSGASGQVFITNVKYVAQSDIANIVPCSATVTGKSVTGTVTNLGAQFAEIAMGGGGTVLASPSTPSFQLVNVPSGPQDLLAYVASISGPSVNDRIIIRRDQNIADGGALAAIDVNNAAEFFNPASALITVTGGGSANFIPTLRYLVGTACVSDSFTYNNNSYPSPITMFGVPTAKQRATDFHNMVLQQINSASDQRTVTTSFHTMSDHSIGIGAGLGAVNVTTLAGSYLRLQAAFNLASDYQSAAFNFFTTSSSNFQQFFISQSTAFLSGATAITLAAPDLSTVAGWQSAWGPSTTAPHGYTVTASSTPPATLCAEGATTRTATATQGIPALRQK